ncbi:MAG TPA: metallophosphoesterase family protein [Armatimonadota bacterium]|nr:metallophosphoesterase family protein [Armatimonadota bacterium]
MRLGIISDIHANLDALEAVERAAAAARGVAGWVCLGDTVGYGPQPNECAARVRQLCDTVLIGNHDLAAIGRLDVRWFNPYARAAAEWTRAAISNETRSFLESLPETSVRPDWNVTFAHGSLTDPPRDYILNRFDARVNFKLLTTQALFIGHSHLCHGFTSVEGDGACDEELFHSRATLALKTGYRYIINCGSVGQPRDGDPRAAFGILDLECRAVEFFRVEYDIAAVQSKMLDAELPAFLSDRLARGQ